MAGEGGDAAAVVSIEGGSFLGKFTCADLPKEADPLILDHSQTPTEAFRRLQQSWVRACPVRNTETGAIVGVLDLQDACRYLVDLHNANKNAQNSRKRRLSWIGEHPTVKAQAASGHKDILFLAKQRSFQMFKPSEPLANISHALGGGHHIVGVCDEETGQLKHVVTQGVMIRFLAPLCTKLSQSVKDLMKSPVISIKATDFASKAFDVLSSKNISGLAVLDDEGGVVDNCSITDVKMLISAQDGDEPVTLFSPIEDFLKHHRKVQEAKLSKAKMPVAKCTVDERLNAAIKKLVRTGYHHCWIVDNNASKRTVGVLSLTDVFALVTNLDLSGQSNESMDPRIKKSKTCTIL